MYVPYHMHSMLSNGITNIDSITNYKEYIKAAQECGMPAIGIGEHGVPFEWVHKKNDIEAAGMKFIHCTEAYMTEQITNETYDLEGNLKIEEYKTRDNYHIMLIAKNFDGVLELNEMISKASSRKDGHYYYSPRITLDELENTSENILFTTACLGGAINNGNPNVIERVINFMTQNKNRCWLEIQHHNCQEQKEYNLRLVEISKELGIPLICGTDTHALNDDQMESRKVLQLAKKIHFPNEDEFDMTFKTPEELLAAYRKQGVLDDRIVLEAMEETLKLANMVEEFKLDDSPKYPILYSNSEEVFKKKVNQGTVWRKIHKKPNKKEYYDRINYEYEVYKKNGAIDFMLLEEDYKSEMRKRNVRFGYSRGSVSGSLIAYVLGITEVDSLKYNLNFERFMNSERVSMADIDTDWFSSDRNTVKDYLYQKKGLYCCDIVTFNTIDLKGAIRDVGRGLDMPLSLTDEIAKNIEWKEQEYRNKYPILFKHVDAVRGCIVSVGNHPSACVVAPKPIDRYLGTFTTSNNEYPISIINMKEIDSLRWIKLDVLGLDNVGLIYKTCDELGINYMTPDNVPHDDEAVWKSIRDDTTMIFQWESDLGSHYIRNLMSDETVAKIKERNPDFNYMDLFSMGNGALRPAGESYRNQLAQGIYKEYDNEALNNFMKPTLGYLIYQETIMEFLHKFCGFTMGQADIVRRGFAKKTGTEQFIPKIEQGFIETMKNEYGVSEEESKRTIKDFLRVIEDASSYLFSKNHSDPYSWIGYICGYLRYYYPYEFITVALNIFDTDIKKSADIIRYANKIGISIKPIKFRESRAEYSYNKEQKTIYKGISSIKYMNAKVAEELYKLKGNRYNTFVDLLIDIINLTTADSRQIEILICLDYFSEFGEINNLLLVYSCFKQVWSKGSSKFKNMLKKELLNDSKKYHPLLKKYIHEFKGKETELTYTNVDTYSLVAAIEKRETVEPVRIDRLVQWQQEYYGYINIRDEKYKGKAYVVSVDTKYAPKIELYALKDGSTLTVKVSKKDFKKNPIKNGDIIQLLSGEYKLKTKKVGKEYVPVVPYEREYWMHSYRREF